MNAFIVLWFNLFCAKWIHIVFITISDCINGLENKLINQQYCPQIVR